MSSVPTKISNPNRNSASYLGCVVFTNWRGLQFQGAGILKGIQENHVDFRIYKNISVPPRGQGSVFFVKSFQLNNEDVKLIGFVQRHRDSEDRPGFVGAGCCSLGADPASARKAIATLLDLQDDVSGWATPNARENFYFERRVSGVSRPLQTLGTGYRAFEFDDSSGELDVPDALMALWYTAWIRPEEALFAVPSEVNGGKAQILDRKLFQRIESEFEAEKKRSEVFPDTQIVSHANERQLAKSSKIAAERPTPTSLSDTELMDPKIIRSIVSEINILKQTINEKDREIGDLKESLNGIIDFLETRFRIKKNNTQSNAITDYSPSRLHSNHLLSIFAPLEKNKVKIGRITLKLRHFFLIFLTVLIIILLLFSLATIIFFQ